MDTETLCVLKADGTKEPFKPHKLEHSLIRAGAGEHTARDIVEQVAREFSGCVRTRDIYRRAYRILKRTERGAALRYNLRRAVMELGPSGFPFEQFVAQMLKLRGYRVRANVYTRGWCVRYEIDVSARKDGIHHLIECKYHNQDGVKTDLKTALYIHARAMDIEKRHEHDRADGSREHRAWLVTNTKLTTEAIKYCRCADVSVVAWNYPQSGNLQDLIMETGVHPITAVTTLSKKQKRILMDAGIVLCRQVYAARDTVRSLGIPDRTVRILLDEIAAVCGDR